MKKARLKTGQILRVDRFLIRPPYFLLVIKILPKSWRALKSFKMGEFDGRNEVELRGFAQLRYMEPFEYPESLGGRPLK
jgi:hypothetical protein